MASPSPRTRRRPAVSRRAGPRASRRRDPRAAATTAPPDDPLHPAVLSLISSVIRQANDAGVPVTLCGEMAGDVQLTRLLLGFGLRDFSMHPANLLPVKQRVLMSNLPDILPIAARILRADDPDKLRALVAKLNV